VNKVIIRSSSDFVDFALLKDGKLIELHKEEEKQPSRWYFYQNTKPVAGLNAFVNVGFEKTPFTLSRLRSQLNFNKFIKLVSAGKIKILLKNFQFDKEIDKDGTITDVINANQSILVQVVKNQYLPKAWTISSRKIYFLVPFSDRVSIFKNRRQEGKKETKKTCTIHQTKRIWCYFLQ
jgi:ribonuclease G